MFLPSQNLGRLSKCGLANHLAESLNNIAGQVAKVLSQISVNLRETSSRINAGKHVPPLGFALYFQIITALENDDFEVAGVISNQLMNCISEIRPAALCVFAMSPGSLGVDRFNIISTAFTDEFFGDAYLNQPDIETFESRKSALLSALSRIQTEIPELYAELSETIDEIVLAKGNTQKSGYTFDGASSLQYWGAIALNAALPKTQLRLIEAIAHEAAHNTLFGLSPYDHFVFNSDSERYTSPLREDLRPLDGIFHATFVLARMHYAISRMSDSKSATETERQEAVILLQGYRAHFMAGYAVLEQHANYTTNGAIIMAQAASYMSEAAS
jgi:hypothetical protein